MRSFSTASQPGNKHFGDQLGLMSEKKLRPALLSPEEINDRSEKIDVLTPFFLVIIQENFHANECEG